MKKAARGCRRNPTSTHEVPKLSQSTLLFAGVVDPIEMSDVAAFLAAGKTDVLSAAKAADGGYCLAKK